MKSIFVSYSHFDEVWLDRILQPFRQLEKTGAVSFYVDRENLRAGVTFDPELQHRLELADAFLILVDHQYITSEYVVKNEWPAIRRRLSNAKLFWLPVKEEPNGQLTKDSAEILTTLRKHQAAHGCEESLGDLIFRPARFTDALLRFHGEVEKWLSSAPTGRIESGHRTTALSAEMEYRYCDEVIRANGWIRIANLGSQGRTINQLPLEDVYVTLNADQTSLQDRLQTRALHEDLAREKTGRIDPEAIAQILRERSGCSPAGQKTENSAGRKSERIEDVIGRQTVLVILGDPGSGKSVLCKWIAVRMAQRFTGRLDHDSWLGEARVPILIRVARLAEYIDSLPAHQELSGTELMDFLSEHAVEIPEKSRKGLEGKIIGDVCRAAVEQQRSLILIDGLDEVIDPSLRARVSNAIERFVIRHIMISDAAANGETIGVTGNQIVLTSRVTGYDLAPLAIEAAGVFLIRPLEDAAIQKLSLRMGSVLDIDERWENTGEEFYNLVQLRSKTDWGIERLKRNPLLLTSLFVYFVRHKKTLPSSRATLYERLLIDLAANWKLRGSDQGDSRRFVQQMHEGWEHLRAWLDSPIEVLGLLACIAIQMHENSQGGRITQKELEESLKRLLPRFGLKRTMAPPELVDECAQILLWLICESLGAIVELSTKLYGFMHLTFQEYLVGWGLVNGITGVAKSPDALAAEFTKRMDDPRWKVPLLFAFGNLVAYGRDAERQAVFAGIRSSRSSQGSALDKENAACFLLDLVKEIRPEEITDQELELVLLSTLDAYTGCTARASSEPQRWRLSEKIAELRRVSDMFRKRVDGILLTCFLRSPDPAPIAHLLMTRYWLGDETLKAFVLRVDADSENWGWPIVTALRRTIPENQHLLIDPAAMRTADTADSRARTRYEVSSELWEQLIKASTERRIGKTPDASIPQRHFFLDNPAVWNRVRSNSLAIRLAVAVLGCTDDLEAIRWSREYRSLAEFLTRGDKHRDALINALPEQFLWRWGNEDIVLAIASYLDSNQDRKDRSVKPPSLGPNFITVPGPDLLTDWFGRLTESESVSEERVTGLDQDDLVFTIGRICIGRAVDLLGSTEHITILKQKLQLLKDGAFRALRSSMAWLGLTQEVSTTAPSFPDAEQALLFRYFTSLDGRLAGIPLDAPNTVSEQACWLDLAILANLWGVALARAGDDPQKDAEHVAVLLNSLKPEDTGLCGPLPLLAQIWSNRYLDSVYGLERRPRNLLWGVSPEERLAPPEVFEVIDELARAADEIYTGFGEEFATLFGERLAPLPAAKINNPLSRFAFLPGSAISITRPGGSRAGRDLQTKGTDPFVEAAELEWLASGSGLQQSEAIAAEKVSERLAERSPIDACLFLVRLAVRSEGDARLRLLRRSIRNLDGIKEIAVKSELMSRLRPCLDDEEWKALCGPVIERIRKGSRLLAAHAKGLLASYLCDPEFEWNRDPEMAIDPAWIVLSVYGALENAVISSALTSDLWGRLEENPSLESVGTLIEEAGGRGIQCTEAAARCLTTLSEMPEQADGLALERLVTLLERPTAAALPWIEAWLKHGGKYSCLAQSLRTQAALMLAERHRTPSSNLLMPILRGSVIGDNLVRTRCDVALGGRVRYAERTERRFALSSHDPQIVRKLSRVWLSFHASADKQDLAYFAGSGLFDWYFDSQEIIQDWCSLARPRTRGEGLLLAALRWVDMWTVDAQRLVAEWAISEPGMPVDDRAEAIVGFAARLIYLKKLPTWDELPLWLRRIPPAASVRRQLCFPGDGRSSVYSLAAEICRSVGKRASDFRSRIAGGTGWVASTARVKLEAQMVPLFSSDGGGPVYLDALRSLGCLAYLIQGESPEDCRSLIEKDLESLEFCLSLLSWTEDFLNEVTLGAKIEPEPTKKRLLEALLSFATVLSALRPEVFARYAEPAIFGPRLGAICFGQWHTRTQMAAVTLMSRLRTLDLDASLPVQHRESTQFTVFDSLIRSLGGKGEVQARAIEAAQSMPELKGEKVIGRFRHLLRDRFTRGTTVIGATDLLAGFMRSNRLSFAQRQELTGLIGELAAMAIHQRPLYREVGLGSVDDPIAAINCGDLAVELSRVGSR